MKDVTLSELKELVACRSAVIWFVEQNTTDLWELYEAAKRDSHLDWANWYLTRQMNGAQRVKYAIFAAGLALPIYEATYPNDDRLRHVLDDLKTDNVDSNKALLKAQRAALAADGYLNFKESNAAYSIYYAVHTARYMSVAYASTSALHAAYAGVDWVTMLDYGLKLLQEGGNGNT